MITNSILDRLYDDIINTLADASKKTFRSKRRKRGVVLPDGKNLLLEFTGRPGYTFFSGSMLRSRERVNNLKISIKMYGGTTEISVSSKQLVYTVPF